MRKRKSVLLLAVILGILQSCGIKQSPVLGNRFDKHNPHVMNDFLTSSGRVRKLNRKLNKLSSTLLGGEKSVKGSFELNGMRFYKNQLKKYEKWTKIHDEKMSINDQLIASQIDFLERKGEYNKLGGTGLGKSLLYKVTVWDSETRRLLKAYIHGTKHVATVDSNVPRAGLPKLSLTAQDQADFFCCESSQYKDDKNRKFLGGLQRRFKEVSSELKELGEEEDENPTPNTLDWVWEHLLKNKNGLNNEYDVLKYSIPKSFDYNEQKKLLKDMENNLKEVCKSYQRIIDKDNYSKTSVCHFFRELRGDSSHLTNQNQKLVSPDNFLYQRVMNDPSVVKGEGLDYSEENERDVEKFSRQYYSDFIDDHMVTIFRNQMLFNYHGRSSEVLNRTFDRQDKIQAKRKKRCIRQLFRNERNKCFTTFNLLDVELNYKKCEETEQRSEMWVAEKILPSMKKYKLPFILCGINHLCGDKSVLKLLEKQGCKVTACFTENDLFEE